MDIDPILNVLIVLGLANGAPILAARLLGERLATPIDKDRCAADGYRWLGASKTWRGLASAYLLGLPVALGLGFSLATALSMISLSMLGDLCSSFIKRRCGLAASSRAIGLDQIPEAGLPVIFLWVQKSLTPIEGLLVVVAFLAIEMLLSRLLFHWHIRKRPY